MDTPTAPPSPGRSPTAPRDAGYWAHDIHRLTVGDLPSHARNLNVAGRLLTSPVQGFGKMWQKTYLLRLEGAAVSPEEVVATWRARFAEFWPKHNWFFGSLEGIKPGDVAVLNLSLLGMPISTGVLVLYADDTTFTVMTPEGHQFAGFNTFSAHRDGEETCIRIQALIRASDPIYEIALPILGHRLEDRFWTYTLQSLAAAFGVEGQDVSVERVCVDKRRQWRRWTNVWNNAAIRSGLWLAATPLRLIARPFRGDERNGNPMTINGNPLETKQQTVRTSQAQAPVLVVGKNVGFLDVQHSVQAAEEHLAREHQGSALALDDCDYFDGIARPLQLVVAADGGVISLEVAPGEAAQPDLLRARINALLQAAQETYDPVGLPLDSQVDTALLQPVEDQHSFARFVDILDRRFNDDPGKGKHVAGRLHNLWHAIT